MIAILLITIALSSLITFIITQHEEVDRIAMTQDFTEFKTFKIYFSTISMLVISPAIFLILYLSTLVV